MNILITGGAGFIGSHTAIVLSKAGHNVIIYDNFCNSKKEVLIQLEKILDKKLIFIEGDVRDIYLLREVFKNYDVEAVIHFAGLKAVGLSTQNPLDYYANNVVGSICLLQVMNSMNVRKLVFSSSATVYGDPQYLPIDEEHPTNPTNPYGRSKLQTEEILRDLSFSDPYWSIISLRYFNPVGAHESGLIGENPNGVPNNLMPMIMQVGINKLPYLKIYGNDYPTPDGTGIRDYIHVMDLADAHLAALEKLLISDPGFSYFNLGSGKGFSVLEIIKTFEQVNKIFIPVKVSSRRQGDIASCFSDSTLAESSLCWKARKDLETMCANAWHSFNCAT
jgi:UDP-glucose 4-epimerase